jgi:CPA1 family monovalent cation:H+ antiporter
MHETELVVWALLVAAGGLLVLAQRFTLPYPIFLVGGGLLLALIPGLPDVELKPRLVLLIMLPPLLYAAAFFSSLRDLRANLRSISLLAVGLVVATIVAVALVAHAAIDHLSWAAAFTLGAVLSPTDPTAVSAIARRLPVPRRVVTILEGESLINDSTALIAYKFAVAAAVTGSFSAADVGMRFVVNAVAGVAIGLAVGWAVAQVRRRIDDPPTEIAISLVTAYLAYLPAEALGVSSVLAAVTTGIYLGWKAPVLVTPETRIQLFAVWEILVFVLNSVLFILVGLQLRTVVDGLSGESMGDLAAWGAIAVATVVAVRFLWAPVVTVLPRMLSRRLREEDPIPPWQNSFLVAYTGMRGAVTLAAALALPRVTDTGTPFPGREVIIFLAFCVVVATVLLQGLSLPVLLAALRMESDGSAEHEEAKARLLAADAALKRIDELEREDWVREDTAERMRGLYRYRRDRFKARFDAEDDGGYERRSSDYQRLRRELLDAERRELLNLRRRGVINDDVMHRVERDLDLEDVRLEI